ncbi:MAG: hypothetical protein GY851_12510 [bacterium]|nr:hypothetical protein [bacterium]
MIPPILAHIRLLRHDKCNLGCWLPLVLLWPLLAALALVAAVLGLIAGTIMAVFGNQWARAIAFGTPALWRILAALRGLGVELKEADKNGLAIRFW